MKICRYQLINSPQVQPRLGILDEVTNEIIDPNYTLAIEYERMGYPNPFERADHHLPSSLSTLLNIVNDPMERLTEGLGMNEFLSILGVLQSKTGVKYRYAIQEVTLLSPIDRIPVYRDFYVHEKHVKKGFEKRKEPVPPEWYQMPVYYKGNPASFIGPSEEIMWPIYTDKLDYELELAAIMGKPGRNIHHSQALSHVFGFTILNDVSARDIQKKEMKVRLGPSKGKDFCGVIGPFIVTLDEFDAKEPNLLMQAFINGKKWSEGKSGEGHFSFAQMIEFASQEELIQAGDLIGSGTVGTGCGLELDKWIQPGDEIELIVEKIGSLKNKVGMKRKH
jgi:2-keto-4-pentenoate hydratase/2-oxohepta-3-ene-1,7-dioic acid hydratase in catechol pathway